MGVYRNIKCGKCKFSFTDGFISDNGFMNTNLGIPFIECPKCKTINHTGWIPWSKFPLWKKIYHWISVTLRGSFFGLALGALLYGIVEKWVKLNWQVSPVIYFSWGIALMILLMVWSNLKDIKNIEERYTNKNWKTSYHSAGQR